MYNQQLGNSAWAEEIGTAPRASPLAHAALASRDHKLSAAERRCRTSPSGRSAAKSAGARSGGGGGQRRMHAAGLQREAEQSNPASHDRRKCSGSVDGPEPWSHTENNAARCAVRQKRAQEVPSKRGVAELDGVRLCAAALLNEQDIGPLRPAAKRTSPPHKLATLQLRNTNGRRNRSTTRAAARAPPPAPQPWDAGAPP